ncbi:MAG: DUF4062 domain-containing protein [Proteobacteria bacterium]|nr:DUF4062 domain-containing protein [Pseudomonadota bacterium]
MAQANRTFRIFVSSTFDDLKAERNALQKQVFPKLRELCLQHGCRFQAIDLRWGVSEEAALDQQTMKICLEEIARCQQVTPRPNFVVLLGDRYGWCPLPYEIPASEFSEILHNVTNAEDTELLSNWYRRDDNAVPPVYDLQPRTGEYVESANWVSIERRLRSILLEATSPMNLSEEERSKYWASATEQEIIKGALKAEDALGHVFCFFRSILVRQEDGSFCPINKSPLNQSFQNVVDLNSEGNLDHNAWNRLAALKNRLEEKLPNNIFRYRVKWNENGVSTDYLNQFCNDVLRNLTQVIEREIAGLEEIDPLDEEIGVHEAFGKERIRAFTGREDILTVISDYIKGPSTYPYVIHGESGSGKTALMAKTVEKAREGCPEAKVFCRFIGATPESSDGRSLLERLCNQIYHSFDFENQKQRKLAEIKKDDEDAQQRRQEVEREYEIPTDFQKLSPAFRSFLSKIPSQEKLILFIDALDQLADTDHARSLTWLPSGLPQNIRVIVSTLPGECFSILERRLPENKLKELESMPLAEGTDLLKSWLKAVGRTLQNNQMKEVLNKFDEISLPLYLKLAFEEARQWKSYSPEVNLSHDIPGIIRDFFKRLSSPANHGKILVSHSMGYLAAAKNGLAEDELLDVLSLDKTVFDNFADRAHHELTETKLPVVIWLRLYHNLESYLTERTADGTIVLSFYHRQLLEVVDDIFFEDGVKQKRHSQLANYFDKQPLWMEGQGKKSPNIRKVSELPYQQTYGQLWDAIEKTLCNLFFIEVKCAAGMTYELISDFNVVLGRLPEAQAKRQEGLKHEEQLHKYTKDICAYANGVIKHLDIIHSRRPWSDEQHGAEVQRIIHEPTRLDHLWTFFHFVMSESNALVRFAGMPGLCIQQAYNAARSGPVSIAAEDIIENEVETVFLLRRPQQRPEFNPHPCYIRTLHQHTSWVTSVCITLEGARVVSGGWDPSIRLWDMETGECLFSLEGQIEEINSIDISADGRMLVSGGWGRVVQVWDMETRECLFTLAGHTDWVNTVNIAPDRSIAVSGSRDRSIRVWDLKRGKAIRTLRGHTGSVQSTYIVADRHILISGSQDHALGIWDLKNWECIQMLKGHTEGVESVFATPDGKIAVSGGQDCTVRVWDVERGECIRVLDGHSESVESVCITPDGSTSVSASQDFTLRVWNISTGKDMTMMKKHNAAVESVDVTPDGKKAVSGGRDWTVKVWGVQKGELLETLKGHENIVKSVCLSPCGKRAVSGSWDQTLRVWELEAGKHLRSIKGSRFDFEHLSLSLDGKEVLDRALRTWELDSGKSIQTFSSQIMQSGAFAAAHDGKSVATGCTDHTIRIWDLQSGKCLQVLEGHKSEVTSISIAPDVRRAVSGSKDRTMKIWDLQAGRCIGTIEGHTDEITSVSITPDAMIAVSGGWDRTLRVWNLENRECIAVLPTISEVTSLSRIGAGGIFACGTDAGEVILLAMQGLETHPRATTPVRYWTYDGEGGYSQWEDDVKAVCYWCGEHFRIPAAIFGIIGDISGDSDSSKGFSTCFRLPVGVWDDSRLLFNCPECHNPLKISPFLVDNRDR